jgi:hypothetical protein
MKGVVPIRFSMRWRSLTIAARPYLAAWVAVLNFNPKNGKNGTRKKGDSHARLPAIRDIGGWSLGFASQAKEI